MKKIVKIKWIDSAASDLQWMFLSDIPEDIDIVRIISFGVVVKETDEFITIAQNYGFNPEQCSSLMTIPKGCIKSIDVIGDVLHEDSKKNLT